MSEQAVTEIAKSLDISMEAANAIWLKVRQAVYTTLHNGSSVDLGFAYLSPHNKEARRRHDLKMGTTVTLPEQKTLKILIPPHVKEALGGRALLSPYVYYTRAQIKALPDSVKESLFSHRLDYYRLKGVTV